MAVFKSSWATVPFGFARYRLCMDVTVASQNVAANQSTLEWRLYLEKDRSQNGFYGYASTDWEASIDGSTVTSGSGANPNAPWTGWSTHTVASGRHTVTHDDDGTMVNMPVAAKYERTPFEWAPGTMTLSGSMTLPAIARATVPSVTPSPATHGASVTINLPRAVPTYTHDVTWASGSQSGTIGTGLGASTTWTVPNVMGEFPGQSLAPVVITATTFDGATNLGSRQVTLFVRNAPPAPSITPLDLAKQFDVRAREVTFSGGQWRAKTPLPAATVKLVDPYSATATCSIELSLLNVSGFADYSVVDIDVFNGNDWVFTNHRFVLSRVEGDDVDPTATRTYSGVEFVDYSLGFAYAQKDYEWEGVTPGKILSDLITDAKARDWGPRFDFDFSATETSLGETWANTTIDRKVPAGTPISQVLEGLVTDGVVEYSTAYHSDKAWLVLLNPGTGSSYADEGASPVVNLALAPLLRAPRRGTVEHRLTRVTVEGDDDIQATREKAAFDSDVFGQLEGWVSASGVATLPEVRQIGDNALRDNSAPVDERTFEYSAKDVAPNLYPYSVFRPGDWVLTPSATGTVPDRTSQVTVSKTLDGLTLTVLTGDRILSGTASLAKRQAAQTGGSIAGGNGGTPAPLDSRIPSAPVVTSVTSAGYWNSDGAARSEVTVEWAAITEALNGSPINVDLYEVWWREAVAGEWAFAGATDQLSIALPDWDVQEDIVLRVRGRSAAGIFGEFSEDEDHTTLAPAVDIDGPDIADIYTDGVGSIYVVWGGFLDGEPAPARLAYVVAEVSTDGGTTYTTTGTPITGAGTLVLNMGDVWGDYLVRLRGYDRLGNAGEASAPAAITLEDPHINPPAPEAPDNLTVTAGAAWDATGMFPTAWFDLEWDGVTLDVNGDPVDVVGYDVWGSRSGEPTSQFLTSVTEENARIMVADGEEWSFSVRAASSFGALSSFSDSVSGTANATVPAAPAPAAPTLDQYAGILRVRWSGGGMLPQIRYVYAAISTSPTGTFTRAGMPLTGAGEVVIPGLAPDTDYYAKIVMVDERGQASASDVAGPEHLLPITGVTVQTSELANTGIKMTSAALVAYDDAGVPTFILDATTGEVWIAPYDAVFALGAPGAEAETGDPTTGLAISSENSSFNTFIHASGVQIRNDQIPLSWWEADADDASLVNFNSPRAVVGQRLRLGDYEVLRESASVGSRLVFRYRGD